MHQDFPPSAKELPAYKCHKTVKALKIKAILNPNEGIDGEDDGERLLTFSDEGYEACVFLMDAEYMRKHKPVIGGYYVVYDDGYKSFSPAKAFEEGYMKVILPTVQQAGKQHADMNCGESQTDD